MFSAFRKKSVAGNVQSLIFRFCTRSKSYTPLNTVIMFVPQQEAWIVERMGKFNRILNPGLNVLAPILDRVKYVQSLKEIAIDVPKQSAITLDNVTLDIDGVLYLRVVDAYLASYGVEDPEFAVTQLAQTTMRSELGKIPLDKVFQERESLNLSIVCAINKASESWGIACLRYEIRDIRLPTKVKEAMQMQVEAERRKRATILAIPSHKNHGTLCIWEGIAETESEGVRDAEINVAEGKRQATILSSEAERQECINKATGEAQAIELVARARSQALELIGAKLKDAVHVSDAASLLVAENYIKAFANLAKTSNTLIMPSDVANVSNFVAQATSIYKTVIDNNRNEQQSQPDSSPQKTLPHYLSEKDNEITPK